MKALYEERILANRRSSAQLSAAVQELPSWYLALLRLKGYRPEEAARQLIGYSNTTEYDLADKRENAIKRHLGLPTET